MSIITVNQVSKHYGTKQVLNDVSFTLEAGDRMALIGSNGSGKSTLVKIITGKVQPDYGKVSLGRGLKIGYMSQNLADLVFETEEGICNALYSEETAALERRIAEFATLIEDTESPDFQDILNKYAQLVDKYERMDGYISEAKIRMILMGLGLRPELMDVPVNLLSGGEKMRVALARALLQEPDLLILDEPTNHLDIAAMEWLEKYLMDFPGAVLFVSHDRYFLEKTATAIGELEFAHLKFKRCTYSNYISSKEMIAEFASKEAVRLKEEIRRQEELAVRLKAMRKISSANSRLKVADRLREQYQREVTDVLKDNNIGRKQMLRINFEDARFLSREIVKVENLTKAFDQRVILDNISFDILGGQRIGIIGANGCGKSTLLRILTGEDTRYSGTVKIGDWVNYGVVRQEVSFGNEEQTILELFENGHGMTEKEAKLYAGKFMFHGQECDKSLKSLSGGERARLYLAELLLQQKDCLMFDEPTNHLDIDARGALEQAISQFTGTLILITHDRMLLEDTVDRIFDLSGGKLRIFDGSYTEYRELVEQEEAEAEQERLRREQLEQQNRKRAKQENKKKAKQVINYEKEIMTLEARAQELEEMFATSTDPDLYKEYNQLHDRITELYDQWEQSMS
ncbi:MAG: ATP-binding cassette domain-containing protein [Clostridia bacterium]|nr:ATP-binding cassette domain-containing protein [Clostridia bacterium]